MESPQPAAVAAEVAAEPGRHRHGGQRFSVCVEEPGATFAAGCREDCRSPECGVTDAGAEFIEEGVKRRKHSPEEIEARVQAALKIAAECAELLKGTPEFTENDLYDEHGLPA